VKLTFFTKPDCRLCDAALFIVRKVSVEFDVSVEKVDITTPEGGEWHDRYKHDIPVLHLDGEEIFRHRVSESDLRAVLSRAAQG
jgi:hypothetical protein